MTFSVVLLVALAMCRDVDGKTGTLANHLESYIKNAMAAYSELSKREQEIPYPSHPLYPARRFQNLLANDDRLDYALNALVFA